MDSYNITENMIENPIQKVLEMKGTPLILLITISVALVLAVFILGFMVMTNKKCKEQDISTKTIITKMNVYLLHPTEMNKICFIENGKFQCGEKGNADLFTLHGTSNGEYFLTKGNKFIVHDGDNNFNLQTRMPYPMWRIYDLRSNMILQTGLINMDPENHVLRYHDSNILYKLQFN